MDLPYVLLGFKLIVSVQDSNMNVHLWVITGKDFHKAVITAMLNVIRSMENTSPYRLYDSFFQYCAIYWHPFLEKNRSIQKLMIWFKETHKWAENTGVV